jgi:hypothetical protein
MQTYTQFITKAKPATVKQLGYANHDVQGWVALRVHFECLPSSVALTNHEALRKTQHLSPTILKKNP